MFFSVIQWIADTTEFFKELGPLVTELTGLLTTVGICVTVAYGIMNRKSIQKGTDTNKENTERIKELHTQNDGILTKTTQIAHAAGVAEGNLTGRLEQTAERKEEQVDGTVLDKIPNKPVR